VNQTFIKKFGFKEPIGSLVNLRDGKRYIIGVTGDMVNNVYRGYESIPEIFLPAKEEDSRFLVVKTEMDNREAVFDWLTAAWKEVIPYKPFNGYYQENMAMGGALQTTNNLKTIFFYLAILGSLLSLTGIFALSTLNVASKLKEIGIRKVMGATPKGILMRLNRKFMIILSISTLGGGVISYFMINMVLSTIYEYHTSVKIYTLILAVLAIAGIAMATTAYTILKAANTNPAMILRNE
jgi:ABC-type antimicrobial peptide transport system permease subunit